jgi:H+/Cl- antiporter ClcA
MSSTTPEHGSAPPPLTAEQAAATIRSRQYVVLLVFVAVVGVVVSLATWCFLEVVHQIQREVYTHLPHALGYGGGAPRWWGLIVLPIAGVLVALAITRLPGRGGHIPARGLATGGATQPRDLPGIMLAAIASISLGVVLGPEAPLIALGSALGLISIRLLRRDAPDQVQTIVAAAGTFAAMSLIFASPLIAAVILIEATGLGGPRLPLILLPGLLAAGVGSLVSVGMGSFTGLSTSAYALDALPLSPFGRPHVANFGWTIALGIAVAAGTQLIMRGGLRTFRIADARPMIVLPIVGLLIGGLTLAYAAATGHTINDILFSGQDDLPGIVGRAGSYSVGALVLVIICKGIAYSVSLGSFRGGPTFPAMFLGVVAGILFAHLPGMRIDVGVAVGMAAGVAAVLRLPLTAVVIGTVLTAKAGAGVVPLIIVGVVVTYVMTVLLSPRPAAPGR